MIYDENYMILDEDEDLDLLLEDDDFDYDSLLDEDYENTEDLLLEGEVILDGDEEVLLEGEVILDGDEEVLLESPITSASGVDTNASQKAIKKAKEAVAKKISGGKYRAYKSSDKPLVEKAIKNKNLLKMAAMTIAGSLIGSSAVVGGKMAKNEMKNKARNAKADKGLPMNNFKQLSGPTKKEEYNDFLNEAVEFYLNESFDQILNEKLNKKIVGATAGGGVAGGVAGNALARKILSGMKYTVFTMDGLTILSLYSTSKEGEAKGKSVCYALATATDGSKLFMHKIGLKSK